MNNLNSLCRPYSTPLQEPEKAGERLERKTLHPLLMLRGGIGGGKNLIKEYWGQERVSRKLRVKKGRAPFRHKARVEQGLGKMPMREEDERREGKMRDVRVPEQGRKAIQNHKTSNCKSRTKNHTGEIMRQEMEKKDALNSVRQRNRMDAGDKVWRECDGAGGKRQGEQLAGVSSD